MESKTWRTRRLEDVEQDSEYGWNPALLCIEPGDPTIYISGLLGHSQTSLYYRENQRDHRYQAHPVTQIEIRLCCRSRVIEIEINNKISGRRSLSPMERPNMGKSLVSAELNKLPDTSFALPHNSSYPMVTFAVTTPRHARFHFPSWL